MEKVEKTIKLGKDGKYRYGRYVVVRGVLVPEMWIFKTSGRLVVSYR